MRKFALALVGVLFFAQLSAQASETAKGVQKDFEKFKMEMSVKLDSVERQLVELRAKASSKGGATQEAVIGDLEKAQAQLKKDLGKLQDTGKNDWQKLKSDFAESLDRLNSKIQKAVKD